MPLRSLSTKSGLLVKYRPYSKASYLPASRTPQELVWSQPPAEKKGVEPKILRKEERSTLERPQLRRKASFSS